MTSSYNVVNGASCQDIDHDACLNMAKQNSNMCSDATLAMNVCPQYCGQCPLVCYSCPPSTGNTTICNSVTCARGEQCMIQKKSSSNGSNIYNMLCGPKLVCANFRKRSLEQTNIKTERSLTFMACCDTDLCNIPSVFDTTTTTISHTPSTAPSTLPTTSPPQNYCVKDVVIMIEDTFPISNYFGVMKDNLKLLISNLDIGQDKTRVSISTFHDSKVTNKWQLNSYNDKNSLLQAIDNIKPLQNGWSLFAYNKIAVYHAVTDTNLGDRSNVPNVLLIASQTGIVMHDHDFYSKTHASYSDTLRLLRQQYPEVVTMAVAHADITEMRAIASDPRHYFYMSEPSFGTFRQMDQIIINVANTICP
ncbi:hypothetical protein ACF0H5_000184 [Mactra antiquata]